MFCQFGTANGSKYYNTHEPLTPLLWRRSLSAQIIAVANSKCFIVESVNKTQLHLCPFNPTLPQNPTLNCFKLQILKSGASTHCCDIILSLTIGYFLQKCTLGVVINLSHTFLMCTEGIASFFRLEAVWSFVILNKQLSTRAHTHTSLS